MMPSVAYHRVFGAAFNVCQESKESYPGERALKRVVGKQRLLEEIRNLKNALRMLQRGDCGGPCWCEKAIDNPMRKDHSDVCWIIRKMELVTTKGEANDAS